MRNVEFMEEVEESVDAGALTFLLFTRESTDDRGGLIRRIDRLMRRIPEIHSFHLDLDNHPTAAGRYTVYRTPAFVIYYRGTMVSKVEGGFEPAHVARTLAALLG